MTMGSQAYGVQVGNETYSVVATDEDWEKRRIERERQKRLSQETNRRRKALEERKKLAEEREARKRILQLSKRKQRQTEVTEKYQRAHISSKNDKKHKNAPGSKRPLALDNVLQQLRSGNTEISYPFNSEGNRNASTQLMNHSRFKFESKLQEEHQRLLNMHKASTAKEFNEELHNVTSGYEDTDYSFRDQNGLPPHGFYAARPAHHSSVDLMSGQVQSAPFYPNSLQSHNPSPDAIQARECVQLAESLSRLFAKNDPVVSRNNDVDNTRTDNYDNDRDDVSAVKKVHSQPLWTYGSTSPPERVALYEAWKSPSELEMNMDGLMQEQALDDEDSLHGGSGLGASPVFRKVTSSKHHAGEPTSHLDRENSSNPAQEPTKPPSDVPRPPHADPIPSTVVTSGYYVKSYRPWSAVEADNKGGEDKKNSRPRPMSAVVNRARIVPNTAPASQSPVRAESSQSKVEVDSPVMITAPRAKTTATPISQMYTEAWVTQAEPGQKTPVSTPQKTPVSTPQKTPIVIPHTEITTAQQPPQAVSKPAATAAPDTRADARPQTKTVFTAQTQPSPVKEPESPPSRKSILRGASKYASRPSYHNAGVAARQQWVDHMTSASKGATALLDGENIRDSLDGKTRPKSVRWHGIHYDDGTSATFTDSGTVVQKLAAAPPVAATAPKRSPRGGKGAKKPPNKPKAKQAPEKSGKKSPKGAKGRKLKPAKEGEVPMEPHPPPVAKKQLSMATNLTYSIASDQARARQVEAHKPSRTAWDETGNVTMDTLKSSGSPDADVMSHVTQSRTATSVKNQVTIEVDGSAPEEPASPDPPINLTRTPTDQEINWLWEKVRTCIAQRPNHRSPAASKSSSEIGRMNGATVHNRQAMWSAPPSGQQRASIVSIDGGMFSRDNTSIHTYSQARARRTNRPNSAVVASNRQNGRLNEYSANLRRQALLQQRRNKLLNLQRAPPGGQVTLPPRYSHHYPSPQQFAPQTSNMDPFPSGRTGGVDDSTTSFLLAETLAEQNLSEEQISRAMDSLQRRTREAQSRGRQVMPSALSMEEQQLLKSLERLNSRLSEVEAAVSANPNIDFFHTTPPRFHDHRVRSAGARQQRLRGRY